MTYIVDPISFKKFNLHSKKGYRLLDRYLNYIGGGKCTKFRKGIDPKCNDQDNCEWIVGKGCVEKTEPKTKKKPKVIKRKNCQIYKKTKEPKCDDQDGCKWFVNNGCLSEDSNPMPYMRGKPKEKMMKKQRDDEPKHVDISTCEWDKGLLDPEEELKDIPIEKVIKLENGNCYNIDELVGYLNANNGRNVDPIDPGKQPIWKTKKELLRIINYPSIDKDNLDEFRKIMNKELEKYSDKSEYLKLFNSPKGQEFMNRLIITGKIATEDYNVKDDYPAAQTEITRTREYINDSFSPYEIDLLSEIKTINGLSVEDVLVKDTGASCIHGIGFKLCSLYFSILNTVKEISKDKFNINLFPGIVEVRPKVFMFCHSGFPPNRDINSSKENGIIYPLTGMIYDVEHCDRQGRSSGGTGRILKISRGYEEGFPPDSLVEVGVVYGFSDAYASQQIPVFIDHFEELTNTSSDSLLMQFYDRPIKQKVKGPMVELIDCEKEKKEEEMDDESDESDDNEDYESDEENNVILDFVNDVRYFQTGGKNIDLDKGIVANGECMFHSLAKIHNGIFGGNLSSRDMRIEIIDYIRKYPGFFRDGMMDTLLDSNEKSKKKKEDKVRNKEKIEAYDLNELTNNWFELMGKKSTWGDETCLAVFCTKYDINLIVLNANRDYVTLKKGLMTQLRDNENQVINGNEQIKKNWGVLAYVWGENHYQSFNKPDLQPTDELKKLLQDSEVVELNKLIDVDDSDSESGESGEESDDESGEESEDDEDEDEDDKEIKEIDAKCLSGDKGKVVFKDKPMLANKVKEGGDYKGWYASEKYDGYRAIWNGKEFISRNGNIFNAPEWFKEIMPPSVALDGELWVGRGKFEDTGIIRRGIDKLDSQEWIDKNITYQVFDLPNSKLPFEKRMIKLKEIVDHREKCYKLDKHLPKNKPKKCPIQFVKQVKIESKEQLDKMFNEIVDDGGEGVMIRKPASPYEMDKRSQMLLKLKKTDDRECVIIGYKDGTGRLKGHLGALECEFTNEDGKKIQFNIGSGLTDQQRENPGYKKTFSKGTVITFTYNGLGKNGRPRHPRFLRVRKPE